MSSLPIGRYFCATLASLGVHALWFFLCFPLSESADINASGLDAHSMQFVDIQLVDFKQSSGRASFRRQERDSLEAKSDSDSYDLSKMRGAAQSDLKKYFSPVDLTERPKLKEDVNLELPYLQEELDYGPLEIAFLINEFGKIDQIVFPAALSESARDTLVKVLQDWEFYPAKKNGLPVKSEWRIELMEVASMLPT